MRNTEELNETLIRLGLDGALNKVVGNADCWQFIDSIIAITEVIVDDLAQEKAEVERLKKATNSAAEPTDEEGNTFTELHELIGGLECRIDNLERELEDKDEPTDENGNTFEDLHDAMEELYNKLDNIYSIADEISSCADDLRDECSYSQMFDR